VTEWVPVKNIRVFKMPNINLLSEGTHCEALYSEDGLWYPCNIERLNDDVGGTTYEIKFKKYGAKVVVPRDYLRMNHDQTKINKKRLFDEAAGVFKTPEHLRIKKSDTEA
jgi:survival-of-motor-neuron-related-splicing factor 30